MHARHLAILFPLVLLAQPSLRLERTIPLPAVKGGLVSLAVDARAQRFFVATPGSRTVEVIDLRSGERVRSIRGIAEPRGLEYVPAWDRLFVTSRAEGSVRIFHGSSYRPLASVTLGDDPGDVRFEPSSRRVWAGYGAGALVELTAEGKVISDIRFDGPPESFAFERNGPRVFVNLKQAGALAAFDRRSGEALARTAHRCSGFALDDAGGRIYAVDRELALLKVFNTRSLELLASVPTVPDPTGIWYDARRRWLLVAGAGGQVAILDTAAQPPRELARIAIPPDAGAGLWSLDLDRLFLALPGAVRIYAVQNER